MRPLFKSSAVTVILGCALAVPAPAASAASFDLWGALPLHPFVHSSPGYLGIYFKNIGPDAPALRLKNSHGAEILVVDHDAPAGKAGLRAHDVILRMNGAQISDCDQLRHMLRKQTAGRTITLVISRDGNQMNVTAELVDRVLLEQQAWSQHYSVQDPDAPQPAAASQAPSSRFGRAQSFIASNSSAASHFLGTLIPNSLYVGADVNPVRTQLADYFGVTRGTGLLVENVDVHSPASRAGLRAGDVILKVNSIPISTRSAWFKAIRINRGKLVQVTIVREKQQQTLTMSAGKLKNGG